MAPSLMSLMMGDDEGVGQDKSELKRKAYLAGLKRKQRGFKQEENKGTDAAGTTGANAALSPGRRRWRRGSTEEHCEEQIAWH